MFTFYGGQVVKKGIYWNLSNGESIELEQEKVLPGDRQVKYLKVPTAGIFILGPLSGLLFSPTLPRVGLPVISWFIRRIVSRSSS